MKINIKLVNGLKLTSNKAKFYNIYDDLEVAVISLWDVTVNEESARQCFQNKRETHCL